MEKMRSFVVPPEEGIGYDGSSSDDDDDQTNRSLTDEAVAAEGILEEALSFAVSREGSLLSLESAPRIKAVEMGRQASALSLVDGYDVEDDNKDDCVGFSDHGGDSSHRSVKRSTDPVFVKAPKGNPTILTQRSWDAIVEMENDNDIGDRRLRTVLSEEQLASLKSPRKWDNLRADLKKTEKSNSKGNVLKRSLKKIFKRKEKPQQTLMKEKSQQPVKENVEPLLTLESSKSQQPAVISPVSTVEPVPSTDSVSEESADLSKSSTPSSAVPHIEDLTSSSEEKTPTVNVVQTEDRSETVDSNSDDGKNSEEVETVAMEGLEVPLESLEFPVVESLVLENQDSPSANTKEQDDTSSNGVEDHVLDSSLPIAPDDASSDSVGCLEPSVVQEEASEAMEVECKSVTDDMQPETSAVFTDMTFIGIEGGFESPEERSPEVPVQPAEDSQDDMKRRGSLWGILKKGTSHEDESDNSKSQEDPPGLIQSTDNDSDDSDCTDDNLITVDRHKITVETQEGQDFEEKTIEEASMEVEYSESGVVGIYGNVCCGILSSFGSNKP